jgi:hypothetical protein
VMAAPKSPVDVYRGQRPTPVEQHALDYCIKCAREGKVLTRLDLCLAIGSQNYYGGTGPGILNRLVDKGFIERRVFQRGVMVRPIGMNEWTATPPCTVPHWRDITDRPPVPAIQQVRQRDMTQAQWMETTARRLGRDYLDFAMEIQKRGIQDYKADEECGQ